jgi:hypothetical protein
MLIIIIFMCKDFLLKVMYTLSWCFCKKDGRVREKGDKRVKKVTLIKVKSCFLKLVIIL